MRRPKGFLTSCELPDGLKSCPGHPAHGPRTSGSLGGGLVCTRTIFCPECAPKLAISPKNTGRNHFLQLQHFSLDTSVSRGEGEKRGSRRPTPRGVGRSPREGTGSTGCCCRADPNGRGHQPCTTKFWIISAMRPSRSCSSCRSCYGTGPDNGPRSSGSRPCGDSSDPAGVGI